MTDYKKLVKALRYVDSKTSCDMCVLESRNENCTYENGGGCLYSDAADAIEALQAEVERLKDSNEELREKQTFIDHYGTEWMTSAKDVPTAAYEHGYADGRDEAMAKMEARDG